MDRHVPGQGPDADDEDTSYEDGREDAYWRDREDSDLIDGVGFADPGGESALRATHGTRCFMCGGAVAETDHFCRHCGGPPNPRAFPCPECRTPNVLTRFDVASHYRCDRCADLAERGGY